MSVPPQWGHSHGSRYDTHVSEEDIRVSTGMERVPGYHHTSGRRGCWGVGGQRGRPFPGPGPPGEQVPRGMFHRGLRARDADTRRRSLSSRRKRQPRPHIARRLHGLRNTASPSRTRPKANASVVRTDTAPGPCQLHRCGRTQKCTASGRWRLDVRGPGVGRAGPSGREEGSGPSPGLWWSPAIPVSGCVFTGTARSLCEDRRHGLAPALVTSLGLDPLAQDGLQTRHMLGRGRGRRVRIWGPPLNP